MKRDLNALCTIAPRKSMVVTVLITCVLLSSCRKPNTEDLLGGNYVYRGPFPIGGYEEYDENGYNDVMAIMYRFGIHDYDTVPRRTGSFIFQEDSSVTDTTLQALGHLVSVGCRTYLVTAHIPNTWIGPHWDTLTPEGAARSSNHVYERLCVNYDSSDHALLLRVQEFSSSDTAYLRGRLRFWYERARVGNSPYTDRLPAIWIDRAEDITLEPKTKRQ